MPVTPQVSIKDTADSTPLLLLDTCLGESSCPMGTLTQPYKKVRRAKSRGFLSTGESSWKPSDMTRTGPEILTAAS